jgi:ribulose-phosphate 3-epimerase
MTVLDALPRDRLLAEFSLWSADLARLAEEIARVDPWVDLYHVDVADGHFSPALLFFPDLVEAVRKRTARPLHVHLMVSDAILLSQVEQFADAGADLISLHAENAKAAEALDLIGARGLRAGLVLQLHTPVAAAAAHRDRLAMLTLLGTRIGVKGQGLDPGAEARLREARALIGPDRLLAADGGIREHTVPGLRAAGADTVVMGSLAFNVPDLPGRIAWVRSLHG